MSYESEFTGHEVDKAVARALGSEYGADPDPGCSKIGIDSTNPANLNDVILPGSYTVFFFYNGPDEISTASPIRLRVFYEGNAMWQWIMHGTCIYRRNFHNEDTSLRYIWEKIELSETQVTVIDNLKSNSSNDALSARQGMLLKTMIDSLDIGGENLLMNSAWANPYSRTIGWSVPAEVTIAQRIRSVPNPLNPSLTINKVMSFISNYNMNYATMNCMDKNSGEVTCIRSTSPYLPITSKFNTTYTASVYVDNFEFVGESIRVFIQIGVLNSQGTDYITTSQFNSSINSNADPNAKHRISVKLDYDKGIEALGIEVTFGIIGPGKADFAAAKLEDGVYATAWSPSYRDLYNECINAKRFYDVELEDNTTSLIDQQAYVYNAAVNKFIKEFVSVGGGGGFVQSDTEPSNTKVLWYNTSEDGDEYSRFYRYNDTNSKWEKAFPTSYILTNVEPNISRIWFDTSEVDDVNPATIKYYDEDREMWRMPVTAPSKCFEISEEAPTNKNLIWIHSSTHIMRVYDVATKNWIIVHSAWGENAL